MAEIEFKRRGTPLWAVLLALIVIALVVWLVLRGGDETAPTPGQQPTPTQPAPTPPPAGQAPAPAGTAVAEYSRFVTERAAPPAAEAATYVSDGLRLLANALQERYPLRGVQINLVRSMADSLRLPDVPASRQTDMAQAAFFAAGYAMGREGPGGPVSAAASQVQLQQPLRAQMRAVRGVFEAARAALADSAGAPAAAAPGAPKS